MSIYTPLTKTTRKVLEALIYFCQWRTFKCWARQSTIAEKAGCSLKTVERSMRALVEKGYGSYVGGGRKAKVFTFGEKLHRDIQRLKNAKHGKHSEAYQDRKAATPTPPKKMSGQAPKNVGSNPLAPRQGLNNPTDNKKNSLTDKARDPVAVSSHLDKIPISNEEKEQLSRQCSEEDIAHGVAVLVKSYSGKALELVKNIAGFIRRAGEGRWAIPLTEKQRSNRNANERLLDQVKAYLSDRDLELSEAVERGSTFVKVKGYSAEELTLRLDECSLTFSSVVVDAVNDYAKRMHVVKQVSSVF